MEKEPLDNLPDDSESNEIENGRESKRKTYPVKELKYMIDFVAKIYNELGVNLYHSREDIAKQHKLAVESIKQTLSTAQQYNLLDLKHGTGFKVSSLFVRIYKPLNEEEKRSAVIESLQSSEIIGKLLTDYNGHTIPGLPGISNNIVRSFQLKDPLAQKVAEIFVNNLKDYNLIDSQNTLSLNKNHKDVQPEPSIQVNPVIESKNNQSVPEEGVTIIPIPLKTSGKKAYLHIPDGYTDADLNRISKFVNALKDDDDNK